MRLIWTGEEPVSETRLTLKARGYEPSQLGLSEQAVCRIGRRFPVLISQSGRFVGDAFSFFGASGDAAARRKRHKIAAFEVMESPCRSSAHSAAGARTLSRLCAAVPNAPR